ncbi:MAG TPA: 3-dehydroquinate synthase [Gemmatimonadaceae bacterium]|nr:3-dehydroquinate synthase [Gemmatimonadaceae bacterium]
MRELTAAGSRVVIAAGALDQIGDFAAAGVGAHRTAIITDSNVGPLYAKRAAASLSSADPIVLTVPAGEAHKTRETWARLTDELLSHGLGRDTLIVALGGGVVGDIAGFVAATYLRGVPVVQVPTSLVAMIDASIGGKTGVDVAAGKNLVGAFHTPSAIVIDPDLLATLPARELRCGLAEALKHGAIADAEYFARIAEQASTLREPSNAKSDAMRALVAGSVGIKARVVNEDPRESGQRKILNFGHTIGHAIEAASGYALAHGEAVAVGMVLEAALGERMGVTASGVGRDLARAIASAGLPTSASFDARDIVARTRTDKKKAAGRIEYALPASLGRFGPWTTPVDDADVLAILDAGGRF